jgi:hypothetical protein
MKTYPRELQQELRDEGASPGEASQLEALAIQLQSLKSYRDYRDALEVSKKSVPAQKSAQKSARKSAMRTRLAPIAIIIALLVGIGLSLAILSQSSLPGQILYPVKKLSENAIATFDPDYKGTMMTRRSQEVKDLVSRHAGQGLVLSTIYAYQNDARGYKTYNYEVLEKCKDNLTAARRDASPDERRAIDATLETLKNI